ncbi:MAG: CPBP family intramembrane glutamic endopeptidase [Acidimicrobiia bacterium]
MNAVAAPASRHAVWAEAAIAAVAVATNVGRSRLPVGARLAANLGAAGTAVAITRRAGVSWRELGLEPERLAGGLVWGAVTGAALVAGLGAASSAASVRARFADERIAAHGRRQAAFEMGARIPFETALAEELIFRGAWLGLALHRRSAPAAVVTTSAGFGLWHALPTWNDLAGSAVGAAAGESRAARAGAVAAVVVATAGAGAAFAVLRLRSRSVIAPVLAHAALNVTSFAVSRAATRRSGDGR